MDLSANVGVLVNAILLRVGFENVSSTDVRLWRVSLPADEHFTDNLSKLELPTQGKLMPAKTLLPLFSDLEEEHVHVIVDAPSQKGRFHPQRAPCDIF